jgi:outer membrane protein TolC
MISLPRSLTATLLVFLTSPAFCQTQFTLRQAIASGLKNNYSIQLQQLEARIAGNNNTPGNAGFLPDITLGANQNNTFSTTHQEQFSGTTKDITGARNQTLNASATLNWTLFDGFSMFVNKQMLNTLEDLGENGTRIVLEGTVSDITLTYFGIIQLGKLVRVAQDAVDLSMQRKRIAEAKLSLGAGSQLMLLQSSVDLNADSTRLIQQQTAYLNAEVTLNRLLAEDVTQKRLLTDSIHLNDPVPFDTLLTRALQQNTQIIAARLHQDLARSGLGSARAARYPTLNFTAGYSYNTLNSETGFLKYNQSFGPSFGFSLSYTLFNGFNVNRTIKNAKIIVNSGELEAEDAEQEIRANLLKLYNEYRSNLMVVDLQSGNVTIAAENVGIAFEKYQIGSINDVELREIQKKLIEAEYEYILAQFEAKKAETELLRLSGMLL